MTIEDKQPPPHLVALAVLRSQLVSPPTTQAAGSRPPRSAHVKEAARPASAVPQPPVASGSQLPATQREAGPSTTREAPATNTQASTRQQEVDFRALERHLHKTNSAWGPERIVAAEQLCINTQQRQLLQQLQTQLDGLALNQQQQQGAPQQRAALQQ